ncbi:hypothetical protein [Actinomadura luzonensis]|uniref:hypothetical protein n=1 Tax=Actinomadura luzonensis TaxID=2805427 RepID=UPI001F55E455|nr:hypothetical protein [Actinomadura luzonensis]
MVFHFTRRGTMLWAVDEDLIDPLLVPQLTTLGNLAFNAIQSPAISPDRVRIHRDPSLTGSDLLAADFSGPFIDVLMPRELIKPEMARHLEAHATLVLGEVQSRLPLLRRRHPRHVA